MKDIGQITGSDNELYRKMGENTKNTLRVAEPGIIQSFDPIEQTVTVQLCLREEITNQDGTKQWVNLPLLLDVPIVIPQSQGFALTMPVVKGMEVLVIFGDMCIDSWWSLGGIQNPIERRRHDLSDGFAIIGIKSQPNVIPNYNMDAVELRSISGNTKISLKENEIDIVSKTVTINGINITSVS